MKVFFILSLVLLSVAKPSLQAATYGDELLAALQSRIDRGGDFSEVYDAVEDLPQPEINNLYKQVERAWPRLKEKYNSNFQRAAKNASGKASEHKKKIRDLRSELAAMKSLADAPMKTALKKRGMPILDELRALLLPGPKMMLEKSNDALKKERRGLIAIAGLRD
ncbi:MAG: hypothetical protein KJO79_01605, partial [Verrucomicrobiae bacterium]|nr:hypothetical protein [Verrucomicrobiae bacterium]NNJ85843.1 hypothetical protein [Akkermansiaceae bacterium]